MLDKLNLTAGDLSMIIEESHTLRRLIVEMLAKPEIRTCVENVVRNYPYNKIEAIKAVRNLERVNDIYRGYPELEFNQSGQNGILGLADSKKLVEYVACQIGKPY